MIVCQFCNHEHPQPHGTKRCKIRYLLSHLEDIYDPDAISQQGSPGSGSSTPHMPRMARHASVVELARCSAQLKLEAPVQHAHVMATYTSEWRVKRWTTRRKRKGGGVETVNHQERQRLVPRWVDAGKVRRGEDRLVELFRGPVSIPEELWDALTKSSAEIEQKRRSRARRTVAA